MVESIWIPYLERDHNKKRGFNMLWTIATILFAFWVLGLVFKVASGAIHLLLIVALAIVVINFIKGGRTGTV